MEKLLYLFILPRYTGYIPRSSVMAAGAVQLRQGFQNITEEKPLFAKFKRQQDGAAKSGEREPARPPVPHLSPDPQTGLTPEQAAERMAAGLDNREVASPTKTEAQIVRENIFTFFIPKNYLIR